MRSDPKQFNSKHLCLGLCGCLLLIGCTSNLLPAQNTKTRVENVVTLTNQYIYLSVSPRIGRVIAFGRTGQKSIIWLGDPRKIDKAIAAKRWPNYGGDKVWPNLQSQWSQIYGRSWPPDFAIDNQPWHILNQTPNSLTIQSPVSEKQHLQIRRTFQLLPDQPRVKIQNTITQLAKTSYRTHVWSITQIKPPIRVLLHVQNLNPDLEVDKQYVWISKPKTTYGKPKWLPNVSAIVHDQTVSQSGKLGTMGQWIQAIYPTQIFRQSQTLDINAYYPEQASIEYYIGKDYVEMETLSPARVLQVGQTLEHTVVWELLTVNGS